jgi:hypothetical protein
MKTCKYRALRWFAGILLVLAATGFCWWQTWMVRLEGGGPPVDELPRRSR